MAVPPPARTSAGEQTPSRGRAPHLGPERRRPQVLDAALSLAVRQGIAAVTIGGLAAVMGVTRPVIYACFSDRVDLLTALLDREQDVLMKSVLDALHRSGDAREPEQAFADGFTALLATVAERPESWRLIVMGEPDPAVAERLREARRVVQAKTTAWIRPAMVHWWDTQELDRKLPVLIDLFMSTCESGIRSLLDESNDWQVDDLGPFLGRALYRAFAGA